MGRRGYPPEFRRKVLDLLQAGGTVADVARTFSSVRRRSARPRMTRPYCAVAGIVTLCSASAETVPAVRVRATPGHPSDHHCGDPGLTVRWPRGEIDAPALNAALVAISRGPAAAT
jgi:hypothetical protein